MEKIDGEERMALSDEIAVAESRCTMAGDKEMSGLLNQIGAALDEAYLLLSGDYPYDAKRVREWLYWVEGANDLDDLDEGDDEE